jgi:RNA polymerase sigma-70 factor (ECF subfamily)
VRNEFGEAVTDTQLLAGVVERDGSALRTLYERHSPWLLARLTRRCADPGMVDEVVQDTFLAVWRKPESYQGKGEVAAWIWGIGIRRLIDAFRRRGTHSSVLYQSSQALSTWSFQREDQGRVDQSAEEEALLSVEYGDLAGALNRLSPELRTVMQVTVLDGLTTREAAHLLGIPRGTVKTRMMRARIQLKEELA